MPLFRLVAEFDNFDAVWDVVNPIAAASVALYVLLRAGTHLFDREP
jgi:hypothetical protein